MLREKRRYFQSQFFYQDENYEDDEHTFFVQPTVEPYTVEEYPELLMPEGKLGDEKDKAQEIGQIKAGPKGPQPPSPAPITSVSHARYVQKPVQDWVTAPDRLVEFDDRLVVKDGSFDIPMESLVSMSDLGEEVNILTRDKT